MNDFCTKCGAVSVGSHECDNSRNQRYDERKRRVREQHEERMKKFRERELEAQRSAVQVPVTGYDGPVMPDDDGCVIFGDEAIFEAAQDRGVRGFWAMVRLQRRLNASDMIEAELDEYHEEAGADISLEAMEELQRFLDQWWEKNEPESWIETRDRFVVCQEVISE